MSCEPIRATFASLGRGRLSHIRYVPFGGESSGKPHFSSLALKFGQGIRRPDRLLDQAANGPVLLRQHEIAQLVINAVCDGEARCHRCDLHAFVAMPNHVHLLITPHVIAKQWLGQLKGFTGYHANRILGRHA